MTNQICSGSAPNAEIQDPPDDVIIKTIEETPIDFFQNFYSPHSAIAEGKKIDATIYFLIGQRRIGKTTAFIYFALELWKKYKIKTMWVRSRIKEFEETYQDFLNIPQKLGWVPEGIEVKKDGVYDKKNQFIIFQGLATAGNRRGGGHPDVFLMIFDEFQPEDLRYPKNPLTMLLSLTQTVLSGKKGSLCFCLSNFVSLANPYFVGLDIYPDKKITIFAEKGVVIERCVGYRCGIEEENPWQKVYRQGKYLGYQSEKEDGLIDLVVPIPRGAKPIINEFLLLDGKFYILYQKDKIFYWGRGYPQGKNYTVITPNYAEMQKNITLISKNMFVKELQYMLESNSIRFDSPNTLFAIVSLMYNI